MMNDYDEEHCNPKMDPNSIEESEIYRILKKPKTCEAERDFISDLPDPILVHILSFLPLKDAIKTVAIRRFGKLWLSLPVLDFDNSAYPVCDDVEFCHYGKFMDIIRQVCNHHSNTTLDKVCLRFPFFRAKPFHTSTLDGIYDQWVDSVRQIRKLIKYFLKRKVKVLDIDFMGCDSSLFISDHLTDLSLTSWSSRLCEKLNLPALRVLFLNGVATSDEAMSKVLLGCPSLEDLSMVDCNGLGKLICENPNLKKLMISMKMGKKRLLVSCPHVVSLEMCGWVEHATLLDVSSLVDASVHYSDLFKCEERSYDDYWRILQKVSRCKNFTPCCWGIMVMSMGKLRNIPIPSFTWKNITLKLGLSKWHLPGLSFLLNGCPYVRTLTMYIQLGGGDSFLQGEASNWLWEHDFDGETYLDSQVAVLLHLETITIYCHVCDPNLFHLVKFLLRIAPKLQKMVISTKETKGQNSLTSEQPLELSKMLMLPRASSQAMLYFS